MFEGKKRGSNNANNSGRILLISILSSLVVNSAVFYTGYLYLSHNEPPAGYDSVKDGVQILPGDSLQGTEDNRTKSLEGFPGITADTGKDEGPSGMLQIQDAEFAGIVSAAQTVAKRATAGVVGITVERVQQSGLFRQNDGTEIGIGSGVIVTSNGYIVTNYHVAGGKSRRIAVSIADGRIIDGVVTWSDPILDLAVVKIDLTDLTPLVLGDAAKLEVGEPAIAIGNPLGLEFQRTVTQGIVSALERTIRIETALGINYMEDLIQTDASINPGNSGGPLLNAKGEVVGITTVKVSSAEAMGFAIPVNIVKPIVAKLAKTGIFVEPYLGLFAYDRKVIPYIDGAPPVTDGIYVAYVDMDGPAYKAGIREGHIIREVDGKSINTMLQLRTYIYSKYPGEAINLTCLMDGHGQWTDVRAILAEKLLDGLITR